MHGDLRKNPNGQHWTSALLTIFLAHYENGTQRQSRDHKREAPYEEVVIPQKMERWAAGLSKLSGVLVPDQAMGIAFSNEFGESSKKDPHSIRS